MALSDRLTWSIDMQQNHALRYYRDYWDVEEITEVDKEGKENDSMKRLDYSGIDKIVYTDTKSIHVAQRFRRMRNEGRELVKPDFSIRYETYNSSATEYQKLKENYSGIGNVPDVYGFGITPYGRKVALNSGFKEFHLIDMEDFLTLHFDDEAIEMIGKHPNGDGSMGAYFSISDLEDNGCVIQKWPTVKNRPENIADITEWA